MTRDIYGVPRGSCSCGRCKEYVSVGINGCQCDYCKCAPIDHVDLSRARHQGYNIPAKHTVQNDGNVAHRKRDQGFSLNSGNDDSREMTRKHSKHGQNQQDHSQGKTDSRWLPSGGDGTLFGKDSHIKQYESLKGDVRGGTLPKNIRKMRQSEARQDSKSDGDSKPDKPVTNTSKPQDGRLYKSQIVSKKEVTKAIADRSVENLSVQIKPTNKKMADSSRAEKNQKQKKDHCIDVEVPRMAIPVIKMKPCKLLHKAHVPYTVIDTETHDVRGVYKIAYNWETIYVGNSSSNVIQQLRKQFYGKGQMNLFYFLKGLSTVELGKVTVFWLDEKKYVHNCGKTSYLKCIESLQGHKPRFNGLPKRGSSISEEKSELRECQPQQIKGQGNSRSRVSEDKDIRFCPHVTYSNTESSGVSYLLKLVKEPIVSTINLTEDERPQTSAAAAKRPWSKNSNSASVSSTTIPSSSVIISQGKVKSGENERQCEEKSQTSNVTDPKRRRLNYPNTCSINNVTGRSNNLPECDQVTAKSSKVIECLLQNTISPRSPEFVERSADWNKHLTDAQASTKEISVGAEERRSQVAIARCTQTYLVKQIHTPRGMKSGHMVTPNGTQAGHMVTPNEAQDGHMMTSVGTQAGHMVTPNGTQDGHMMTSVGTQAGHMVTPNGTQAGHMVTPNGTQDGHMMTSVGTQAGHMTAVGTQVRDTVTISDRQAEHIVTPIRKETDNMVTSTGIQAGDMISLVNHVGHIITHPGTQTGQMTPTETQDGLMKPYRVQDGRMVTLIATQGGRMTPKGTENDSMASCGTQVDHNMTTPNRTQVGHLMTSVGAKVGHMTTNNGTHVRHILTPNGKQAGNTLTPTETQTKHMSSEAQAEYMKSSGTQIRRVDDKETEVDNDKPSVMSKAVEQSQRLPFKTMPSTTPPSSISSQTADNRVMLQPSGSKAYESYNWYVRDVNTHERQTRTERSTDSDVMKNPEAQTREEGRKKTFMSVPFPVHARASLDRSRNKDTLDSLDDNPATYESLSLQTPCSIRQKNTAFSFQRKDRIQKTKTSKTRDLKNKQHLSSSDSGRRIEFAPFGRTESDEDEANNNNEEDNNNDKSLTDNKRMQERKVPQRRDTNNKQCMSSSVAARRTWVTVNNAPIMYGEKDTAVVDDDDDDDGHDDNDNNFDNDRPSAANRWFQGGFMSFFKNVFGGK